MKNKIPTSIAVNARLNISLHALNNEGTHGSAKEIRRVQLFYRDLPVSVNAISGEMLKYIYFNHLIDIGMANKLPLSKVALKRNPMRAGEPARNLKATSPEEKLTETIKTCITDDMLGYMHAKSRFVRKSLVEFGWMPAIPRLGVIDRKEHSRFTGDNKSKSDEQNLNKEPVQEEIINGETEGKETSNDANTPTSDSDNTGQMRYSMEVATGTYALTAYFDTGQVGFNAEKNQYVISDDERKQRIAAGLEALYRTAICMKGASRTACLGHFHGIEGAVSIGYGLYPAPSVSPLDENFISQIEAIAEQLNSRFLKAEDTDEVVVVKRFPNVGEFGKVLREIINLD